MTPPVPSAPSQKVADAQREVADAIKAKHVQAYNKIYPEVNLPENTPLGFNPETGFWEFPKNAKSLSQD
jgi:hypothetical protein